VLASWVRIHPAKSGWGERDLDVMATAAHHVVDRQRSRFLVGHAGHTFGHLLHHPITIVLVRTAVVRRNLPIALPCDHHVARLGDVFRVFEDVEVLVFDLLALSPLLTEVEQFGVLFRTLHRLEELTACICCFRGEIRRVIVNTLFGLEISYEVDSTIEFSWFDTYEEMSRKARSIKQK
jgi:hypothetical protein